MNNILFVSSMYRVVQKTVPVLILR